MREHEHLRQYVDRFKKEQRLPTPRFFKKLSLDAKFRSPNIIYPLSEETFAHVYMDRRRVKHYVIVEPTMDEAEEERYHKILLRILEHAPSFEFDGDEESFKKTLNELMVKSIKPRKGRFIKDEGIALTPGLRTKMEYRLMRDLMYSGMIEPLLHDPYLEDIHNVGVKEIYVVHKVFGMVRTSLKFKDSNELEDFLRMLSEKVGKPVSDTSPIIDAALPDGSRINIIYSEDVSREGPSFTIRKFAKEPLTITQLVGWGTFSPQIAAYLWLALENGMSIFISGETASGKTTSLNSLLTLVNHNYKIYTAEDTPEVVVPQEVWQRLITRESGPIESRVEMFDLVKAALRSRPDYIIIGEVRGQEGNVAFQAMQTGHPVISTFHASSIQKMIQRFTGDPINVPIRFIDNMNLALFQQMVFEGGRIIRRCSSVEEILRFSAEKGGILTRAVFQWDPIEDKHYFRGLYNSHILENKIAPKMGIVDIREIYEEMDHRAEIIERMVNRKIFNYEKVNTIFKRYYEKGMEGIPSYLR